MSLASDRGFATVWAVALVAVVAVLCGVAATVAGAMAVRRTAETAADLAALAAAQQTLAGAAVACRSAERIAAANHAVLRRCDVAGTVVAVVVAVQARGVLAGFGPVTARARAGPVEPNGAAAVPAASRSLGRLTAGRNLVRAASLPRTERERAPPDAQGVVDVDVRRTAGPSAGADVHPAAGRSAAAEGERAAR